MLDIKFSSIINLTTASVSVGKGLPQAFLFAFAGLGIFLVTIRFLSTSLKTITGPKFKKFLILFSDKPFFGILFGILFTIIIQSSDGAVAFVMGLLAARLIGLKGAIAFLLGANIGTATTSILVAFANDDNEIIKTISTIFTTLTFLGAIIMIVAKKDKTSQYALAIFSIGAIFVGLKLLSAGAKVITKLEAFSTLIKVVTINPWLATFVSTIFTGIFQSSSATVAIYQNLYGEYYGQLWSQVEQITILSGFIALIIGSNIGTTFTGLIVAFSSGNKNAKRIAILWGLTNTLIAIFVLSIIGPYSNMILIIDGRIGNAFQLSIAHMFFNIILVGIFMWLINPLEQFSKWVIKDGKKMSFDYQIQLPRELLNEPFFALETSLQATYIASKLSYESIKLIKGFLKKPDKNIEKEYNNLQQFVKDVRSNLNVYLIELGSKLINKKQSKKHVSLVLTSRSLERISVLGDTILEELLKNMNSKKTFRVSDIIINEFKELIDICSLMMKKVIGQLNNYKKTQSKEINDLNHNLEVLIEKFLESYVFRTKNNADQILSIDYNIIIKTFERISHHIKRVNNYWMLGRSNKKLKKLPDSLYFELKNH